MNMYVKVNESAVNFRNMVRYENSVLISVGGGGSRARLSIQRPRHCAGSGLARKYKMDLRPISEMESPPG